MQNSGTVGIDYAGLNYRTLCRFSECPAFGTTALGFDRRQPCAEPRVHGEGRQQLVVEAAACGST